MSRAEFTDSTAAEQLRRRSAGLTAVLVLSEQPHGHEGVVLMQNYYKTVIKLVQNCYKAVIKLLVRFIHGSSEALTSSGCRALGTIRAFANLIVVVFPHV